MSNSYNFGQEAEKRAADYYRNLGFQILQKNYPYRKAEVDLIVQKDNLLVVVELRPEVQPILVIPKVLSLRKKSAFSHGNR